MKKFAIALLGSALIVASCKKNEQVLDPSIDSNGNPVELKGDAQALKEFFKDNEQNALQNFTIDAANPQLITGSGGVTIQFNANAFETMNGQPITGNIDIRLIEIYDKKDMLLLNKPTVANTWSGDKAPLISGGEFKIMAYQNGQQLKLKQWNSYSVTVPAPGGVDSRMTLFYGDTTNDTLNWNQSDTAVLFGDSSNTRYNGIFDSLGWINCDYFWSDPRPKTFVEVEIPQGFTNQTCALFISFDGLNSLTNFYNYSSSVYTSAPSYKLPIGLDVHFVAISIIGGNPHVAIIPATITNNHYEVIPSLTQTTAAQLALDIAALP